MMGGSKNTKSRWLASHVALPVVALCGSMMAGAAVNHLVTPGIEQLRTGDTSNRLMMVEVLEDPANQPTVTPAPVGPAATDEAASPAPKPTAAVPTAPTVMTTALEPSPAAAVLATPVAVPVATKPVDPNIRIFNGRRIRPARTLTMVTTAYSPDERSCGIHADGITASGKSVWTNGMKMVAADTRLLPFGTIVSIPGYYNGQPVPVLDRGGAIKGHRLDLLYPNHERALQWGRKTQKVVVWEYID